MAKTKFDRQQTAYNKYIELYFQRPTFTPLDDNRQEDLDFWNKWLAKRSNALSDIKFTVLEQTYKTYTIGAIYTVDTGRHLQSVFIVATHGNVREWYIDYNWVTEHDCVMPVYLGPVPNHRTFYHLTTLSGPLLTEEDIDKLQ